jgi:predicted nucleic acid-binding protein
VDADVLFAGAASPGEHGASLVVLRMAEITLIDAVASEQVIAEVARNLVEKLPHKVPELRLLISRCLRVIPNPGLEDLVPHAGVADPKDLPILVAAMRKHCSYLVTFNVRHFQPGQPDVAILPPGEFVQRVREQLTYLEPNIKG